MAFHVRASRPWARIRKNRFSDRGRNGQDALRRLRSFLDAAELEVARILARFWDDQRDAITYRELRQAVLNGFLDERTAQEWMEDYSRFVENELVPKWEEAMRAGAEKFEREHPGLYFDAMTPGVRNWMETRAGELITVIGGEQRQAIDAMINRAYSGEWTVDEVSRVIRPTIGLNRPQAEANLRYYENMRDSLLKENPGMRAATAMKRAREAAVKYAERQQRYRGFMIARTELAFAYNKGQDESVRQAIAKGYMGQCVRVWVTADDERMCPSCGALEGVEIMMDGEFPIHGNHAVIYQETPPAHPNCRCAVAYEEIAPPVYQEDILAEMRNNELTIPDADGIMPNMEEITPLTEQMRNPAPHEELYGPDATEVDLSYIRSNDYRMKFHGITGNYIVDDKIAEQSRGILESRTGTRKETLVLLDAQTGNVIASISDSAKDNAISYNPETEDAIQKALSVGKRIISIHNHPEGYPPTADDCVSALNRNYQLGVVCGHNGAVYTYEPASLALTAAECERLHEIIALQCHYEPDVQKRLSLWSEIMEENGFRIRKRG